KAAAALVARVVDVDAIEADIERGFEESIKGGDAAGGRTRARGERRESERVAAGERQLLDVVVADGRRDLVGCGLEHRRRPADLDGLGDRTHFEAQRQMGGG